GWGGILASSRADRLSRSRLEATWSGNASATCPVLTSPYLVVEHIEPRNDPEIAHAVRVIRGVELADISALVRRRTQVGWQRIIRKSRPATRLVNHRQAAVPW